MLFEKFVALKRWLSYFVAFNWTAKPIEYVCLRGGVTAYSLWSIEQLIERPFFKRPKAFHQLMLKRPHLLAHRIASSKTQSKVGYQLQNQSEFKTCSTASTALSKRFCQSPLSSTKFRLRSSSSFKQRSKNDFRSSGKYRTTSSTHGTSTSVTR